MNKRHYRGTKWALRHTETGGLIIREWDRDADPKGSPLPALYNTRQEARYYQRSEGFAGCSRAVKVIVTIDE